MPRINTELIKRTALGFNRLHNELMFGKVMTKAPTFWFIVVIENIQRPLSSTYHKEGSQ